MNVKILKVSTDELVGATIRNREPIQLPSMHDGWRFNFDKQIRRLANATAWVLVADESPDTIEGCLVFQLQHKEVPFMSFVEVAPHNRIDPKKYEYVGGCLIAFACKQSLLRGKRDHKGWLSFEVSEENPEDQFKLMQVYAQKYGAVRFEDSNIKLIGPEDGEILIDKFLIK